MVSTKIFERLIKVQELKHIRYYQPIKIVDNIGYVVKKVFARGILSIN